MSVKRGFIDTNVLVYALSEGNEKAARAAELRNAGGVISVQVLNELVNVLRRKLKALDKEFNQIETLYGLGYRYKDK